MSRKDYQLIASVINGTFQYNRVAAAGAGVDKQTDSATVLVAMRMAEALKLDNPRFDEARFLKACGLEGP